MKHYGDITKLSGYDLPPVDVITGGSPCQDLSVAGNRAGLEGERSGLFMEQIRIVKEMRDADKQRGRAAWLIRPRFMVWENVPGAFSSGKPKGADFQAVLTEIVRIADPNVPDVPLPKDGKWSKSGCLYDEMGRWSVAWRVHDAQFWGVPQRRKRIALVADFGGRCAPEVLFERKGLRWDIEQGGEAREKAAGDVGESTMRAIGFNRERCGAVATDNRMPTLQAAAGESGNNKPMVAISFQERAGKPGGGKGILIQDERVGALSTLNNQSVFSIEGNGSRPSHQGDGWSKDNDPMFTLNSTEHHAVAYGISSLDSNAMKSQNPKAGIYKADTSRTLDLNGGNPACNQGGIAVVSYGFKPQQGSKAQGMGYEKEVSPTLNTGMNAGVLCVDQGAGKSSCSVLENKAPTLATTHDGAPAVVQVLNDQGGAIMGVSENIVGSLRA